MRKATKISQQSPTKSKKTKKEQVKPSLINDILPLLDEDVIEHEFNDFKDDFIDGDLELLEEEYENYEGVVVDENFLLTVSNQERIEAIEQVKKEKINTEHPMDSYLKKLIKEVLINDFLPILKQHLKKE